MRKSAKEQDTIVVAATGTSKGKPADTVVKVMELVEDNLTNPTIEVADAKHPIKPTKYKKVDKPARTAEHTKPKAAKTAKPKTRDASLVKEVNADAKATMTALRQEETKAVFDAANRWGQREDLSPLERCHGTAHEVYTMDHQLTKSGQKRQQVRHDAYVQQFEQHFMSEIENRRIRAARELFPS